MDGAAALESVPLNSAIAGAIVVCSLLLRLFPDLQTVFFLVPAHAITRPWMVLTAGFFEDSGINLCVGLAALLGCGVLLRDAEGARRRSNAAGVVRAAAARVPPAWVTRTRAAPSAQRGASASWPSTSSSRAARWARAPL